MAGYPLKVQEREVRLTAQRLLTDHLRPEDPQHPAATYWADIDLDLTGATLVDFDLSECRPRRATFWSATFIGPADLKAATFTSDASFWLASFISTANFASAIFTGNADFGRRPSPAPPASGGPLSPATLISGRLPSPAPSTSG